MSLLEKHLEQISLSAESIATLSFPAPKIFTNALLSAPDITNLIRDTEVHERALFSVPTPVSSFNNPGLVKPTSRRQTVFNVSHGEVTTTQSKMRAPRRQAAVAAVLGPELHQEVKKMEGNGNYEINLDVLLRGIEKLNAVYSVPGVVGRVQDFRSRHAQTLWALPHYEELVEKQTRQLERLNHGDLGNDDESSKFELPAEFGESGIDEEIRKEEIEIEELEQKKLELESRIQSIEKDIGGLMRS